MLHNINTYINPQDGSLGNYLLKHKIMFCLVEVNAHSIQYKYVVITVL